MRLRLPGDRRSRVAIVGGAVCLIAMAGVWIALRAIDAERERLGQEGRIVVESERCIAPNATGVSLWLPATPAVDVEPFGGSVYAATAGGLVVYDERGTFVRRFTSLDGLPENGITCLERFGGKLYAGTSGSGLLEFDGEGFTRFRFVQPAASRVSALRATDDRLLVGTFDCGLFEFDGATFTRQYQADLGDACRQITTLSAGASRVYVGTFDDGLFVWKEGQAVGVRTGDGLPSDRVTGLALREGECLVATDLGIASLKESGEIALQSRVPNASGIAVRGAETWISSLTTGLTSGDASAIVPVADGRSPNSGHGLPSHAAYGLKLEDDVLWAMTDRGLLASVPSDGASRFETFATPDSRVGLSASHVAALAVDGQGRVWAGMFDGGVDVLDAESGERLERVEDQEVREVNAISVEQDSGKVWVASSRGVVAFDGGRKSKSIGPEQGLAGSSATAVSTGLGAGGQGVAIATNAGVTVSDGRISRTITAFHGLPNNHVYAIASAGGRIYAGTLGGLAEIEGTRVGRTFSVSNSRLPHNWVNALAGFEGSLYIGTYGGGVASLAPGGELIVYEETAKADVNPGAMAVVGRRLYVGTLSQGAFVFNVDTGGWTQLGAVLGSRNVTAITASDRYVYFGTDCGIARIERSALQ